MAKQASGAVLASYEDTLVLATAVASHIAKAGIDFLPLTVNYQWETYAAGKIHGGYLKREGQIGVAIVGQALETPLRQIADNA